MLIVFLLIGLGLLFLGIHLDEEGPEVIGMMIIFITVIALIVNIGVLVGLRAVDDKIAIYEQENARIEESIATVIKNYQDYEYNVIKTVSSDSDDMMSLVTLYPELKSDTLITKQIDIYVINNEKIKELRQSKADAKVMQWWLYFGPFN